ncbi:transcription factor MYB114-like [Phalaenopsis equestris]|uniref:transcription factor MYB114-like n=1 Tax=Phalaenopsis equestris TaxID=78828 RepID=UPI0009E36F14|nr:transcription factor MYB114-like [Phalaenopsis equestris]
MSPRTLSISERERMSRRYMRWSSEEDELLRKYVEEHGEKNWRQVEYYFKRPKEACRDRWKYCLRSTVAQHPFTDEEKTRIRQLYHRFGANWDNLRRYTQGDPRFPTPRTVCDIKNYIDQVLLERAQDQDLNPDDVNDNNGNQEAPGEDFDRDNEEAGSPGN